MNDTIRPLPNGDFEVISAATGLPQGTPVTRKPQTPNPKPQTL